MCGKATPRTAPADTVPTVTDWHLNREGTVSLPASGGEGAGWMVGLSLSRLNHRQPRMQAHPEIVQGTTDLHHHITNTFFPQTNAVFDDTTALDTAVDMLDP